MLNYRFPERFTELLNSSTLTYEQVAHKLGIKSKGTISKYAKGTISPDISTIDKIADLFNVSPIWLIGFTDYKYYKIVN